MNLQFLPVMTLPLARFEVVPLWATDQKIWNRKLLLSGCLEQTETKHKLTQADMKADRRRTSRHKQTKNKTGVMAKQTQADRQADKVDTTGHKQAESRAWPDTTSMSRQSFPFRIFRSVSLAQEVAALCDQSVPHLSNWNWRVSICPTRAPSMHLGPS